MIIKQLLKIGKFKAFDGFSYTVQNNSERYRIQNQFDR